MFYIECFKWPNITEYVIYTNNSNFSIYEHTIYVECLLAEIITKEEMHDIFRRHNSYIWDNDQSIHFFEYIQDAQACCDYLNNTYGVIFKLMENN